MLAPKTDFTESLGKIVKKLALWSGVSLCAVCTFTNFFFKKNMKPKFYFSDGLREKEKKELWPVVKQVSYMKENTYHLLRHLWNDVSEDWPFYSEEERQAFRRRKPQNLTPPGSDGSTGKPASNHRHWRICSDNVTHFRFIYFTGSSASGHSSSSSHPASPQPSTSLKRPYAFGNGGNVSPSSSSLDVIGGGPASKKKR